MGADWYHFSTITAVGFILDGIDWDDEAEAIQEVVACSPDYEIGMFASADGMSDADDPIAVSVFVYDKRTLIENRVGVVGPYEIQKQFHASAITTAPLMS